MISELLLASFYKRDTASLFNEGVVRPKRARAQKSLGEHPPNRSFSTRYSLQRETGSRLELVYCNCRQQGLLEALVTGLFALALVGTFERNLSNPCNQESKKKSPDLMPPSGI